jgi:branched-chain amino acid transport system substrate-binding protein
MNGKSISVISVLAILAMVLGACGTPATPQATPGPEEGAGAPTAATQKVLKIGVMGPFTGPVARTGEEIKNSAQMAFEEANYQVGDYTIELVMIDDESDPEKATRAYEEAVLRDGIQAGLLQWNSSTAVAVMEVTAKHKIPHFFGMGETHIVNEKFDSDPDKYGYWMAKGWPMPKNLVSINYAIGLGELLDEGVWAPANRRVAIAGEETDFGRAVGEPLAQYLKDAGWEVVAEDYFPLEEVEFHPLLTKYKAADVSLTVVTATAATAVSSFVKQARETELPGVLVAHGLGWVGEWYDLTGDASDGVLDQIPQLARPEAKAWAGQFEAKFGMKPSPSAGGLAYDWSNMLIKLLEGTLQEYGELNSETIYQFGREKLWTGEFTYTDGVVMPKYQFTPESIPDPVIGKDAFIFPIIQYEGGEGKVIWPLDWAEADLQAN